MTDASETGHAQTSRPPSAFPGFESQPEVTGMHPDADTSRLKTTAHSWPGCAVAPAADSLPPLLPPNPEDVHHVTPANRNRPNRANGSQAGPADMLPAQPELGGK
jgi:hypothetical protein